jgi:hypothetical protein
LWPAAHKLFSRRRKSSKKKGGTLWSHVVRSRRFKNDNYRGVSELGASNDDPRPTKEQSDQGDSEGTTITVAAAFAAASRGAGSSSDSVARNNVEGDGLKEREDAGCNAETHSSALQRSKDQEETRR